MCESHDLHHATPTAPETHTVQCDNHFVPAPSGAWIADPPTRRAAREESFDLSGLGKLPL